MGAIRTRKSDVIQQVRKSKKLGKRRTKSAIQTVFLGTSDRRGPMHRQVHVAFNRPWATSRRKVVSVGFVHKDEGHLEHVFEKFHVVRCEVAMHAVYLC